MLGPKKKTETQYKISRDNGKVRVITFHWMVMGGLFKWYLNKKGGGGIKNTADRHKKSSIQDPGKQRKNSACTYVSKGTAAPMADTQETKLTSGPSIRH